MNHTQTPNHPLTSAGTSDFRAGEAGAGTVTMLFSFIATLMMTSIAVDYANAVRTQSRLQAFADASALAGAMRLPQTDDALESAMEIADHNGNLLGEGGMLHSDDIEFGRWFRATRTFEPNHSRPNAVRLIARRDTSAGNSLPTILMRLVGINQFDLTATALAVRIVRLCTGTGFFSAQTLTMSNTNHFYNGFCVHGEQGVTINNSNLFDLGSTISMADLTTFSEHTGNIGTADALLQYSHTFTLPDTVFPTIDAMRDGDMTKLPEYITSGPVYLNSISQNTSLTPGTLYVVSGNVNLGSNTTVTDVAIVASGNIRIGSNTFTNRLVLASDGNITFNTNNWIGSQAQDVCDGGIFTTYMYAAGNIEMNSNSTIRGVLMGALGHIELGNNNGAIDGVTAEALGPIDFGNADRATACDEGLDTQMEDVQPAGIGGSNLVF